MVGSNYLVCKHNTCKYAWFWNKFALFFSPLHTLVFQSMINMARVHVSTHKCIYAGFLFINSFCVWQFNWIDCHLNTIRASQGPTLNIQQQDKKCPCRKTNNPCVYITVLIKWSFIIDEGSDCSIVVWIKYYLLKKENKILFWKCLIIR